jgi:thioredoxin reductase/bacterioferritin-associated ferredoxin
MQPPHAVPNGDHDLIVVGGGAAGAGAAIEAAACGLRVLLVDETDHAGGQDAMRARLRSAAVDARLGEAVWSVSGAFRVDTIGPDGPRCYEAQAVVAATGLQERVIPFAGWTTPGVVGLAATSTLLKSRGVLPGHRLLIAGCGPLLESVAVEILDRGGEVAAVADLASRRDWPARLRDAGVPVLHRTTVTEVVLDATGLHATVGCVDGARAAMAGGAERRFSVDAVIVGHGLVPATDITRLMRVDHAYDAARGFWHPVVDEVGRSSLPGLYVPQLYGDGPAYLSGRITGLAAACDMGRISADTYARLVDPLHQEAELARVDCAMAATMVARAGLAEAIPADTVVCRCEDVTRAEIDAAVRSGATNLNQLKAWTRCGMGPCQGRICADTAAELLSAHGISRQDAGQFTGRTPLRPLPLDLLTGNYGYADIELPPAAPP